MSKAEKELKTLKNLAAQVSDKEHTRLYISQTVSKYIRKQIIDLIKKEIKFLLIDKELEVITESEFENEVSILRVIYKSL